MGTSHPSASPSCGGHFDFLIVGAGISGIGAAYHLHQRFPGSRFAVLDAMDGFGGTWWTHRYPGARSDSDLYTYGYGFKPWRGRSIATADEIRAYLGEVIDENGLAPRIRYRHKVMTADWSSQEQRWTLEVARTDSGETLTFTTRFLWMCSGYYDHGQGHTPQWPGLADFEGRVVHPQHWPQDLDCAGQRVVVIGSGATAATLVPNIAGQCEHVTVLQRSPTYCWTGRNANEVADMLRELDIDETWIHEIVRRKILHDQAAFTKRSFEDPETVKRELIGMVRAYLGPDFDVETHFTPHYRPWRQRIAFVPDGDIFKGITAGKASVVTDEIETFTPRGIRLKSGEELEADIIVTATGFNMNVLGDIDFEIDGTPLDFSQTVTYRGMMFTGVPNMLWVFGYFRASWTLRADLMADFVCRLLAHMEKRGAKQVQVALRPEDKDMELLPWIDPENFNPGYLMRAMDKLPKRGSKPEWQHTQDYWKEKDELPAINLDGPEFAYS